METELIIGKRYWLDLVKDVSGIYRGNEKGYMFSEIEGPKIYMREQHAIHGEVVKFNMYASFTLIES